MHLICWLFLFFFHALSSAGEQLSLVRARYSIAMRLFGFANCHYANYGVVRRLFCGALTKPCGICQIRAFMRNLS